MRKNLARIQPLCWVFLKEASKHVASLLRDAVLKLVICPDDHFLQFIHVVCSEGNYSVEHGVQNDPCRPYIDAEALIASIFKDLWRNVRRCTTLFSQDFTSSDDFADTKVADFDFTVGRKQNIVQFNVPVENAFRVAIV